MKRRARSREEMRGWRSKPVGGRGVNGSDLQQPDGKELTSPGTPPLLKQGTKTGQRVPSPICAQPLCCPCCTASWQPRRLIGLAVVSIP